MDESQPFKIQQFQTANKIHIILKFTHISTFIIFVYLGYPTRKERGFPMVKKAIAAGILAGLVLVAIFQHFYKIEEPQVIEASKAATGIGAGMAAPNFILKNLAGEEVSLEDYRGKKVMLNFWATWCPPCKEEMPAMQQFYNENSNEVEILAINLDPQNNVKTFVKDNELTFPILLDQDGATQQTYSIISIPTTFILDEKGLILKKHIGSMTYEQMKELSE